MRVTLSVATAILIGLATAASAGQSSATNTTPAPAANTTAPPPTGVDATRLPVNIGRIGRQLRQAQVREERDSLKIRYTVDVYGELPKITFVTPLDNLLTGDVPRTAPTHNDMIRQMTPLEFSTPPLFGVSIPRRK